MSRRLLKALQAIEYILPEQQIAIVKELEPHVLKCVKDANGNHVGLTLYSMAPLSHYTSRSYKNSLSVYRQSVSVLFQLSRAAFSNFQPILMAVAFSKDVSST